MIANVLISDYIQEQKTLAEQKSLKTQNCFIGESGCATVQTSVFATTFGVSNPIYGMIGFTLGALVFAILGFQYIVPFGAFIRKWWTTIDTILLVGLGIGTAFSLWLLYVQFFVLMTSCIYCVWVDTIMIGSFVVYVIVRKSAVQE